MFALAYFIIRRNTSRGSVENRDVMQRRYHEHGTSHKYAAWNTAVNMGKTALEARGQFNASPAPTRGRGRSGREPRAWAAQEIGKNSVYGRVLGRERVLRHGTAARVDRGGGATNEQAYVCAWRRPGPEKTERRGECFEYETHAATAKVGDAGAGARVEVGGGRRGLTTHDNGCGRKDTKRGDRAGIRGRGGELGWGAGLVLGEEEQQAVRITLCQQSRDGSAGRFQSAALSQQPPPLSPCHARSHTRHPSACHMRQVRARWRLACGRRRRRGRTAGGHGWQGEAGQDRADERPREETELRVTSASHRQSRSPISDPPLPLSCSLHRSLPPLPSCAAFSMHTPKRHSLPGTRTSGDET